MARDYEDVKDKKVSQSYCSFRIYYKEYESIIAEYKDMISSIYLHFEGSKGNNLKMWRSDKGGTNENWNKISRQYKNNSYCFF